MGYMIKPKQYIRGATHGGVSNQNYKFVHQIMSKRTDVISMFLLNAYDISIQHSFKSDDWHTQEDTFLIWCQQNSSQSSDPMSPISGNSGSRINLRRTYIKTISFRRVALRPVAKGCKAVPKGVCGYDLVSIKDGHKCKAEMWVG